MAQRIFTTERVQNLALAGAGAATAGFVQAAGLIPIPMTPNIRDLVLAAVGAFAASMGGPMMRSFGVGFGAVPVGALITRNLFAAIVPQQ